MLDQTVQELPKQDKGRHEHAEPLVQERQNYERAKLKRVQQENGIYEVGAAAWDTRAY